MLDSYQEFCDFDLAELQLIEALRSLRIMHYSAWFNTEHYWSQHILELREQLAALQETPLSIF